MNYTDLKSLLRDRNLYTGEGGLDTYEYQSKVLLNLLQLIEMRKESKEINILEIGFNAGASSEFFLKNTAPETKVVSFDLNEWPTVMPAKYFLDEKYPGRHTLIVGDSRKTIPAFRELCKLKRFDLIFVDGGHDYKIAKSDMENIQSFAHKDTIVVLDDVCREQTNIRHYSIGPTRVWNEFLEEGKILELGHHDIEDNSGRGFVWGKLREQ